MRFRASAGLVCLVVLFVLQSSGAGAATLFVRTDGSDTLCNGSADADASATPNCALASIGAAIGAAIASDTVAIGPGTFVENVIVTKALTLDGAGSSGASLTTIVPALSGPTCTSGTGSICTGGSNVILVQADDVTIRDIVVDGDNPALTSGIVSDGADLDARNGIIEDYSLGAFHRLTVAGVVVRNIYLRGIYAASGGRVSLSRGTPSPTSRLIRQGTPSASSRLVAEERESLGGPSPEIRSPTARSASRPTGRRVSTIRPTP